MQECITKKILALIAVIVIIGSQSFAQLTGTITVGTQEYPTIVDAVNALNSQGVGAGGIVVDVPADYTETITSRIVLTATGTAANPITFQKINSGANPRVTAYAGASTPGSAVPDGIWSLQGSDYVTIDGIDLYDPNAANPATMEYGFGLFKASATDGCQYVTIKNCSITLNRINNASGTAPMVEGSVGILVINSVATTATTAITPTVAGGSNSNNKFYSNTIQNCNYGIALSGYAAITPFTLGDAGNDIGGAALSTGNSILNFGGAAAATNPAAGIRANFQWGINISYNTIRNNNGSGVNHVTTLRGIYAQAGTSANATINNNTLEIKGGGTTTAATAIENAIGSTAASNTVSISNNTIQNCTYSTATTAAFYGINNSASAATVNINGNTINNINITGTGILYGIETGSPTTATVNSNTIGTFSRAGASGSIYAIKTSSPTNLTVNSNVVDGLSFTLATSTGIVYGFYGASSSVNVTINSNIFRNFSSPTTGIVCGIYEWGSSGIKVYSNNQIYNFSTTAGGVGGANYYGIYQRSSATQVDIFGNVIYALNSTGTTGGTAGVLYGIWLSAGTTNSIYKNKIYNLSTNSTNPALYGIFISGGTSNTIYNNFIGDLRTPYANAGIPLAGIYCSSGTTDNLYYNTVYLNAASTGALFGSAALYASTTPTVNARNNIFVNASTPVGATGFASAYRRSTSTLTSYASTSNNNLFYAGTPGVNNLIFYDGTNSDQTIAAYKTRMATRDQASFTESPNFVSTTGSDANYLNINTSISTQIESGGSRITTPAIASDFAGDIRHGETGYTGTGSAPDIGADEFNGIGIDLIPPTITYTAFGNTASMANRTLSATITDASGVPISGIGLPVLYWKINAGSYTPVTGSHVSGTTYSFVFGAGVVAADVVSYYIVAQDLATTPNVGASPSTGTTLPTPNPPAVATPPTTPSQYTIVSSISGEKTVGVGQTYETIAAAITDISGKEVTGPITLSLTDANYAVTSPITIPQFSGVNATNTVTIKPALGVTTTISATLASASLSIFKLFGADFIVIDGSNSVGGTTRNLTITNLNTAITSGVVWIGSASTSDGAMNNVVKNCIINGSSSTTTLCGISLGSGATIGLAGEATNSNNTFTNNSISSVMNGIALIGSATTSDQNNNTSLNTLNTLGLRGIMASYQNNYSVTQNTIAGVVTVLTQTTTASGIYVVGVSTNGTITRNSISNVKNMNPSGYGSNGIYLNASGTACNIVVANNLIFDVASYGYTGTAVADNGYGIIITAGGGYSLYYNSVRMTTSQTVATGTTAAINITSSITTANSLDIRNNIFVNNQTMGTCYGIYSGAAATVYSNINNNDYFTTDATAGKLGFLGVAITTIGDWKTATTKDGLSISSDPLFLSNTDLQISTGSPVIKAGYPVSVLDDYLGTTRSTSISPPSPAPLTGPSIGAYENAFSASNPPNNATIVSPANAATGISSTATLNWADGGGGTTGYKLFFGTDNPPTNIVNNSNVGLVTTHNPGTLQFSTTYYWKVVAYNGIGDATGTTVWSFTTDRDQSILPTFVTFDNVTAPALPSGWLVVDANSDLVKWATAASNPKSSPNAMKIAYSAIGVTQDDWFFSRGYNMTAGVTYEVGFWYRSESATNYPEGIEVKYGSAQTAVSMNSPAIYSNTAIQTIVYKYASGQFTPSSSGMQYIGFHCISAGNQYNLYVDDISVKVAPAAANNQTVASGSTTPVVFTGTGTTITFTIGNTGALDMTVGKINSNPGGTLPSGILNLGWTYWPITVTSGTVTGTYSITLDLTGVAGINDFNTIKILKRNDANSAWVDVSTLPGVTLEYASPLITIHGLTSFSEFGVGGLSDNPLPVELTAFTATEKNRDVKIDWKTKTELNLAKFEVERSLVDKTKASSSWKKVGEISASGNSNSPKEYTVTDKKLNSGNYQYRLKSIDNSGAFEYSSVIEANIDLPKTYALSQNYPNPFNPTTRVDYQLPYDAKVTVELYSITGEKVTDLVNVDQAAGYYTLDIKAGEFRLASGVYIYRIIARDKVNPETFSQIKKMVLLK